MKNNLHNSLLDALDAVRRNKHFDAGFIFGAKILRCDSNAQFVTRYDLSVNNTRGVVLRVFAIEERFSNDRFPQIAFSVTFGNTGVNGIFQVTADNVKILPNLNKYDRHTGILTVRAILRLCNLGILDDLIKDNLTDR